jgi:hypothetical protein
MEETAPVLPPTLWIASSLGETEMVQQLRVDDTGIAEKGGVDEYTLASIEDQLALVRKKLVSSLQEKCEEKIKIDESRKKDEEELQASIAVWQKRLCDGMEQQMESEKKKKLLAGKRAEIAEKVLAENEQKHKTEMDEKEQQYKLDIHEMQETFKKALAWERENALKDFLRGEITSTYKQSKPNPKDGTLCEDTRSISQCTRSNKRLRVEKDGPVRAVPWFCARCDLRHLGGAGVLSNSINL